MLDEFVMRYIAAPVTITSTIAFPTTITHKNNTARKHRVQCLRHNRLFPIGTICILVQVLEDEGEEAYFAAFQANDGANCQSLDEEGFVDAIETLAPGEHRHTSAIPDTPSPDRLCYARYLHHKMSADAEKDSVGNASSLAI